MELELIGKWTLVVITRDLGIPVGQEQILIQVLPRGTFQIRGQTIWDKVNKDHKKDQDPILSANHLALMYLSIFEAKLGHKPGCRLSDRMRALYVHLLTNEHPSLEPHLRLERFRWQVIDSESIIREIGWRVATVDHGTEFQKSTATTKCATSLQAPEFSTVSTRRVNLAAIPVNQ